MYKIANEVEPWFTVGFMLFLFLVVGQVIEKLAPGNFLIMFGVFVLFGLGAFLCSAYTTIYDKGREEQEPDEDKE